MRKVIHKYKAKVKRFKHEMYCINFMNIHINMESKIFNEQLKSCFMKSLKIIKSIFYYKTFLFSLSFISGILSFANSILHIRLKFYFTSVD